MRLRLRRRFSIVAVLAFLGGCAGEEAPPSAIPGAASTDPGLPREYYGPKCVLEHSAGKSPECISAVITEIPAGLHLFLNFCVRNGVSSCTEPEIYVSLVLPIGKWEVARVTEAIGGRAWIKLHDGRVHEATAEVGRPIPVDFEITAHPVAGGGVSHRGRLQLILPRVDAPGPPVTVGVDI